MEEINCAWWDLKDLKKNPNILGRENSINDGMEVENV